MSTSSSSDDKTSKKKERLEQNRLSARESRKRKKVMIEELQRTLLSLSRENKELNEQNELLRRQLFDMASKYPNIIPIQSLNLLAITNDPMSMDSSRIETPHEDNSAIHVPPPSSTTASINMNHPSINNSNNNNNMSEMAASVTGTPFANIQPGDAALLASLLFRMSGAPISAAPFFYAPSVQMRAAASAAQLANLEQQQQSSLGLVHSVAGGEEKESVSSQHGHNNPEPQNDA